MTIPPAGPAGPPHVPADPANPESPVDTSSSRRALRESREEGTRSSRRALLDSEPARKKKKSRRGAWGCLIVFLVLIGLAGAAAVLLQEPIGTVIGMVQGPADYDGTGDAEVVVMIHDGDTGQDIANTLVAQDVVKSYDAFYQLLREESPEPVFQPGAYRLAEQMSARAALDALLDADTKLEQTVVIPEGTTTTAILQLITEGTSIPLADLKVAAADVTPYGLPAEATTLEGFLFPATYTFPADTTATDAIRMLVDRQFEALDAAGVAPADRWKTIVLAALIQREAGLTEDFYKVSRVFLNRLDPARWESGLLQSDATVAYGTGATDRVTTTDAERADAANAYNTYVHPGLPVGPISNPGDVAIDAAVNPAEGSWLYFVSWNLDTGETIFSTTIEEHEAAVAKWLAWMDEHPEYD
ncbi:endolytic transglycosylase MltG [Cryobacterium cryoconiti]|uniref:Endolytic murein transglycosylase n=1 Tax=Cryobacterium cryoconiti TaxID=1259239 RepID=A0A4Y8JXV8_9MICO|nr:endolytic transglycosylase MltG [Cryobacterium cryoconiti]TFD33435.1 endolytic transglycosylase MltG [Cryobacterium cryoconiti]